MSSQTPFISPVSRSRMWVLVSCAGQYGNGIIILHSKDGNLVSGGRWSKFRETVSLRFARNDSNELGKFFLPVRLSPKA